MGLYLRRHPMTARLSRALLLPLLPLALTAGGCSAEVLDAGNDLSPPSTRATLSALVDAVTMDDDNLYFACEDGWIYRLAKEGSSVPERIAPATVPGSNFTDGIAVDDANVYWTAQGSPSAGGAVLSAPKNGGAPVMLAAGMALPWGIAVDDQNVYWADQGGAVDPSDDGLPQDVGSIQAVAKSGGPARTLASLLSIPKFVALDGDGIVWQDDSLVGRVAKTGGPPIKLAAMAPASTSSNLVVADGHAFWAVGDGAWSIQSVATTGAGPSTLASDIPQPSNVVVAGSTAFWSLKGGAEVGAVQSVPTSGGIPADVSLPDVQAGAQGQEALFLLVDDRAFYFVEEWQAPTLTVAIRVQPR